jgi:hypothetical protein
MMLYRLLLFLFQFICAHAKLCPFSPETLIWKGQTQDVFHQWTDLVVSQNDICPYVYHVLTQRMAQVQNGERSKSFARYYRKTIAAAAGEKESSKIISTHGRNNVDQVVKFEGPSVMLGNELSRTCREMYFPQDGYSLDLVFTPEIYNVASKAIQERIESESKDDHDQYSSQLMFVPKLFFRAAQLAFNFSPVALTCGIAVVSQSFRDRVWYHMLGSCLAKCGPAFIKWGK